MVRTWIWTQLAQLSMPLLSELKRRNVIRVAIAYLAAAWLLIQVVETLFPIYGLPNNGIRLVVAVLAVGFVPSLIMAWLFELTPEGIKRDADVAEDAATGSRVHRMLDRAIIVVLGLAVSYFAFDKLVLDPVEDARIADQARSEALNESYGVKSIAVLPFLDMSPNQDQEYFADGMSEEILNLLTRLPELKVIARTSSFSFKGKSSDINEIAERLRVTHVLEGSVRKSNDNIRVTAQLVDASTSEHIWSETFDRTLNDVFALQDDIATMVVRELEDRLLDRLPHSRRTDPQAYALFLQARSIARTGGSRPTINSAESLLRQALEIDPDYSPALSTLALVLFFQTSPNEDTTWSKYPRSQGEQLWQTALEAAYASDPLDGEANVYFGWRRFMTESDAEGVGMTELAVAREPNNSEVLRVAGAFARYIGHWDAAAALGQRAIDLDPLCQLCYWNLTLSYLYAGRLQEAENVARKSIALFDHGWHILGTVLLLKGDAEAALNAYDKLQADPIDERQWRHGRALALYSLGRIKESRENLAEFIKSSGQHVSRHISAPQVYAWIGDVDEAFKTLGNMSHPNENYFRHDFLAGAAWHPLFRNLHDDPRWHAYWETAKTTPKELQAMEFNVNLPAP